MTLLVLALSLLAAERPVPPPGVNVPDNDRKELEAGLRRLTESTNKLAGHALEPDVLIYREAVRYALTYNEFFKPEEIIRAKDLLRQGEERAAALLRGQAPWTRHRTRRPRLPLRNRRLHPALRTGHPARLVSAIHPPLAPRHLVPWPQRNPQRGQLSLGTPNPARRVHAAPGLCAPSLRPLLQRE